MTEQDYRKHPALNYSLLADFNISPATALIPKEEKWYFIVGKAFERLLQDYTTGSDTFAAAFIYNEALPDTIPANIIDIICGMAGYGDLRFKKNGELYSGQEDVNAWIDAFVLSGGYVPVNKKTMADLEKMVSSICDCEFKGQKLFDLFAAAEWQVPHIWTDRNGIKKKCLFDCVVKCNWYDEETAFAIDVKSAASLANFKSFARSRYWIQDRHYIEGLQNRHRVIFPFLVFAVCSTSEPFVSQCFTIRENEKADDKYHQICADCNEWVKAGKPVITWKEEEEISVWV